MPTSTPTSTPTTAPTPTPASASNVGDIFDQVQIAQPVNNAPARFQPTPWDPESGIDLAKTSKYASEAALGFAEGLGIDPSHPLTSMIQGIINGAVAIPRLATHANELRETVKGMLTAAPDATIGIREAYDNGDYTGVANGVGRLLAAGGVLAGAGEGMKNATSFAYDHAISPELQHSIDTAPGYGMGGLQRPPVPAHIDALTRAAGKNSKMFVEDRFNKVAADAFPALKAAEIPTLGRPVQDLRDAADVARAAKDQAWKPYQDLLDRTGNVDRLDILRRAVSALPDTLKNSQFTSYKRIVGKFARDLSQPEYAAQDMENAAQMLNAKLKAYYTKNNLDRAAASKLPATAGDESLLSAYRSALDDKIKSDTGYDAAPLRKNYGNIKAVENALIEQPSGDDTLYDVLMRNPTANASPSSAFRTALSHVMRQTPDQQAERAFRLYTPPEPGSSLIHLGPSNKVDATLQAHYMPQSGRLLPENPRGTTVRPMPSGVRGELPAPGTPVTAYAQGPIEGPTGPPGGFRMPPRPPSGLLTTGQRMLPAPGETSVIAPPAPPESFADALARTQTPASKLERKITGSGPFNTQSTPATAEEYLAKYGLKFPKQFPRTGGGKP